MIGRIEGPLPARSVGRYNARYPAFDIAMSGSNQCGAHFASLHLAYTVRRRPGVAKPLDIRERIIDSRCIRFGDLRFPFGSAGENAD
jgi:hypothetical protein